MSKTRHMQARMSKRGIRQEMVDLAVRCGVRHDDKVVLNRKGLQTFLSEIDLMRKTAQKMLERGGLVVIEEGGDFITTYHLNSFKSY